MRTRRGFTLIEIAVTLALFAVLATLAVSTFQAMTRNAKSSGAVRSIYMQVSQARAQARTTGHPVRFSLVPVTRNGVPYDRVRWEELPCYQNLWTQGCPLSACAGVACSDDGGACPCVNTGDAVWIPRSAVTASGLDGLCFTGTDGRPSGSDCTSPGSVQFVTFTAANRPKDVLVIDPLSGFTELVSCSNHPAISGLPCP